MTIREKNTPAKEREERAAQAMRENLRRRKQQQQARAGQSAGHDSSSKED